MKSWLSKPGHSDAVEQVIRPERGQPLSQLDCLIRRLNVIAAPPRQLKRSMFPLMARQYFDLWYRLDHQDGHLLWYTDDQDGIVVDSQRNIPSFRNPEALLQYAQSRGLAVDAGEAILFDLDLANQWLAAQTDSPVDCKNTLNAWNLFDDVSRSVGGAFDIDRKLTKKIYDKLFWGNNLPMVTPDGKIYYPAWTKRELKIMREVLSSGLSLFRGSVRCV